MKTFKDILAEAELQELSKKTLGSYIKKASHDVAAKSAGVARHSERAQQSVHNGDYSEVKRNRGIADKLFDKSWNRRKGIANATDRLMKEEEDDIVSEAERTSAFVFTHKPGDPASEKKLADLKTYIKMHNALQKGTPKRVSLKGRLGKDNPNAKNYRGKGIGSHQTIHKADAAHFDVYVHDRT